MGHLIYFYDNTRSKCCRFDKPQKRQLSPEGKVRIVAAFAAVMLALFALVRVQQAQASEAAPAFFSMLFPHLIPQGLFDWLDGCTFGAVLL